MRQRPTTARVPGIAFSQEFSEISKQRVGREVAALYRVAFAVPARAAWLAVGFWEAGGSRQIQRAEKAHGARDLRNDETLPPDHDRPARAVEIGSGTD